MTPKKISILPDNTLTQSSDDRAFELDKCNARSLFDTLDEYVQCLNEVSYKNNGITVKTPYGKTTRKPHNYDAEARMVLKILRRKTRVAVSNLRASLAWVDPNTDAEALVQRQARLAVEWRSHLNALRDSCFNSIAAYAKAIESAERTLSAPVYDLLLPGFSRTLSL